MKFIVGQQSFYYSLITTIQYVPYQYKPIPSLTDNTTSSPVLYQTTPISLGPNKTTHISLVPNKTIPSLVPTQTTLISSGP